MTLPFIKMQGIGNDFVMVDAIGHNFAGVQWDDLARQICDRKFGVGSDGLILALKDPSGRFRMRMLNPDGSESEMCGNGIRCFLKFLRIQGLTSENTVEVETGAGLLSLENLNGGDVKVDMGFARLTRREIGIAGASDATFQLQPVEFNGIAMNGTAVSMGNPHVVFFVDDVWEVPLEVWGPAIERHELFPERINVHFAQIDDESHLKMRTWERGAGVTLACGTGACAVAVAGLTAGLSSRVVDIELPGGRLRIEIDNDWRVWMTGPAEVSFTGSWQIGSAATV